MIFVGEAFAFSIFCMLFVDFLLIFYKISIFHLFWKLNMQKSTFCRGGASKRSILCCCHNCRSWFDILI